MFYKHNNNDAWYGVIFIIILLLALMLPWRYAEDGAQAIPLETKSVVISAAEFDGRKQEPTYYDVSLPKKIQDSVFKISAAYGVDEKLVLAVAQTESNFNVYAISKTNDYGLMQINKCNHSWLKKKLGITNIMKPEQNIKAAVYMLSNLGAGKVSNHTVLMRYNMGTAGAKRVILSGRSSTSYSRKVMKNYQNLEKE